MWGGVKRFATEHPLFFMQVPLAKMKEEGKDFVQVSLAQITWYHHISLLSKVKNVAHRAFYVMAMA